MPAVTNRHGPCNQLLGLNMTHGRATKEVTKMFRSTSTELNEKLSKTTRQAEGIYFTPAAVRTHLFAMLQQKAPQFTPTSILEPSFGSGEFLMDLAERFPHARITGVEKNKTAFVATARQPTLRTRTNTALHNADFLQYTGPPVDFVVGNPPFFVTEIKNIEAATGRSNIFILFLYKCLTRHLLPGGILAFILPTSFYNCAYYQPTRAWIAAHTTILHCETLADAAFFDTQQQTCLFICQRSPPPPALPYIFRGTYITPHAAQLQALTIGATTITALGCAVKTGDVVWNQHREKLFATPGDSGVLVLYSNNIKDGQLQIGDPGKGKGQYIRGFGRPVVNGPALLIARGYGNTTYALNFVRVPAGTAFYGENHVNVITGPAAALDMIATSLQDPRTVEFISMFVGNGALSKSELAGVLPVWHDQTV
jgi:hypothetical protein